MLANVTIPTQHLEAWWIIVLLEPIIQTTARNGTMVFAVVMNMIDGQQQQLRLSAASAKSTTVRLESSQL